MYYEIDRTPTCAIPADEATQPVPSALFRECHSLARDILADHFSVLTLAPSRETDRLVPALDSNFPGVGELSRQLSGPDVGALCHHMRQSTLPILILGHETSRPSTGPMLRWARTLELTELHFSGIAFPVCGEFERKAIIVFAGPKIAVEESALSQIHWRCCAAMADSRLLGPRGQPSISKRELECLQLTANGLTSESIAATLGLSIHTANQYLTNTAHKLNAVNRIHAVAKALRLGLIN